MLSFGSGCIWAIIAFVLGHDALMPFIWGGMIASPFIGLLMGVIYLPAGRRSLVARILLSLATLYIAVTLFGVAAGLADALRLPGLNAFDLVLQTLNCVWWGTTVTGFVLFLWPLSFLNHSLVCRFSGSPPEPR